MANEFIIRKGFKSQEDSQITGSISLSGSFKDQESSSGTAGQVLSSTVSGSQWVDAADSSAITGAGTTGKITKWTTGGSVIGDSIITEAASAITVGGEATFSSKVKVSDGGNDTTPSFRIGVDTNGISMPFTNQLNFITNSSTKLIITSAGVIITGGAIDNPFKITANPGTRSLRLVSASTNYGTLISWLRGGESYEKAYVGFASTSNDVFEINNRENADMTFHTNTIERMRISSTGAATFSTNSNSSIVNHFTNSDTTNTSTRNTIELTAGNRFLQLQAYNGDHIYFNRSSGSNLYFQSGGSTQLTISSGGVTTLTNSSTSNTLVLNGTSGYSYLRTQQSGVDKWAIGNITSVSDNLEFYNGTTKLTISSAGLATFSGDIIVSKSGDAGINLNSTTTNGVAVTRYGTTATGNLWATGINITNSDSRWEIYNFGLASSPLIISSTGAATFSGQVSVFPKQIIGSYNSGTAGTAALPSYAFYANEDMGMYPVGTDTLGFSTSGINRLTISSGGNVTLSSGLSFFTQGAGRVYTHNVTLREQDNTAKFQIYSSGGGCVFYNSESNGAYFFYTNGSTRLTIGANGNVGLAVSPTSTIRLFVQGQDNSTNYALRIENLATYQLLSVRNDGVISTGGSSGVTNGPYNYAISTSVRDLLVDVNGNLGTASSIRKSKINIKNEINVNWLYDLNPVKFNYRKRDEERNYLNEAENDQRHGLIAEEVEEVNTDFCLYNVNKEGDKTLAGVDYKMLITPMLKAIQEQQTLIESQKSLIDGLTARIETLEG